MKCATMVYHIIDIDISDITCLHHNMVQYKDDIMKLVNSCCRSKGRHDQNGCMRGSKREDMTKIQSTKSDVLELLLQTQLTKSIILYCVCVPSIESISLKI